MKQERAEKLAASLESEFPGLLDPQVQEMHGTWCVQVEGYALDYHTRYLFSQEDVADLEEEFPLLSNMKKFRKTVEKLAESLIQSETDSPWIWITEFQRIFESRRDSFMATCPSCNEEKIFSYSDKCYTCERKEREAQETENAIS